MNVFRTEKLSIGYKINNKITKVFNDISFKAISGELIAIAGKNGIGKSTLLKTLARFQKPINGEIYFNDNNYLKFNNNEWARIASIVTTASFKAGLINVMEVLYLGRYPYKNIYTKINSHDIELISKISELTNIKHLLQKPMNQISDGEQQRVMIARALVQNTPVLLLDEPTAYLDLTNRYSIIDLLAKLAREQNKIIIFSTHELTTALNEADKIWLMSENGFYEGTPEELILKGILNRAFENENIKFDKESLSFKIIKHSKLNIELNGCCDDYIFWTKKALQRIGIECKNDKMAEIKIEIIKNNDEICWKILNKSEIFLFYSIYDLILFFKNNIINNI